MYGKDKLYKVTYLKQDRAKEHITHILAKSYMSARIRAYNINGIVWAKNIEEVVSQ